MFHFSYATWSSRTYRVRTFSSPFSYITSGPRKIDRLIFCIYFSFSWAFLSICHRFHIYLYVTDFISSRVSLSKFNLKKNLDWSILKFSFLNYNKYVNWYLDFDSQDADLFFFNCSSKSSRIWSFPDFSNQLWFPTFRSK